ncbi:MAG: GNAT family N-acetyltransferase [bacterium]
MHLACGPCIVRDWTASDRASLVRFANNRNVWRNLEDRFPHPYTERDADEWLSVAAHASEPTHWAIEVDGVAVGGIGVRRGEGIHEKTGIIGYWLGEPYWGRGIATAAVHATSEHVISRFRLVRLEASVFEWNPASMRVLEKCGFLREGVRRRSVLKDGRIIDSVLFARVV